MYRLLPAYKDYLWGGTKLRDAFGKQSISYPIAESWELSSHPDGECHIAAPGRAVELFSAWATNHKDALGKEVGGKGDFPILIKLIDAKEPLSIQVHPAEAYALAHEHQHGKTEMWYVIDAEPEAYLYYGFQREVTKEEFEERIRENTLEEVLQAVPVKAGDMLFIEAGTIHGIGAGIVIAEIQQSSNVTYRVYDYGRTDAKGNTRPLHIEQAKEVTNLFPAPKDRDFGTHLVSCPYFTVDKWQVKEEKELAISEHSFHCLMCVAGQVDVVDGAEQLVLRAGETILIEAANKMIHMAGKGTVLDTYLTVLQE